MFKVDDDPTFEHLVTVRVPKDGGYSNQDFKARFKVMPPDELDKFDLNTTKGSTDFLQAVVCGMDDIEGEGGKKLEYSDELRDQIIAKFPYVRTALASAYMKAISGARTGN